MSAGASLTEGVFKVVRFDDFRAAIESHEILDDARFEQAARKLKLRKDLNMAQIEQQLCADFGYTRVSVAIKKTMRNGVIRPQILNFREPAKTEDEPSDPPELEMRNREKTLADLCVSTQYLLFVDESESTGSEWARYFRRENHMIVVNFNYPLAEKQIVDQVKYPFRIKVDLRKGLSEFKDMLDDYLAAVDPAQFQSLPETVPVDPVDRARAEAQEQTPVDREARQNATFSQLLEHQKSLKTSSTKNLIMRKGGKSGVELKDLNRTLRKVGFINNSFVFLRFGRKAVAGEIKVNLFYCLDGLQRDRFSLKRKIHFFGESYILSRLTATEVIEQFKQEYPVLRDKQILLREKNLDVLTKIFRDQSLRGQYVFDRKNLVLEESPLQAPQKDEVFVYYTVLRYDPGQSEVGQVQFEPVQEMVVNKQHNLGEMGQLMLEHLRGQVKTRRATATTEESPQSPSSAQNGDDANCHLADLIAGGVEGLSCTKIRDVANFEPLDILGHKFFRMNRNDQVVSSSPFYLENDGCLFILKKKGVAFSGELRKNMRKTLVRNQGFFETGAEQSLQIFVKKKK